MKLKRINPRTPSQRNLIKTKNKNLSKNPLIKLKIKGLKRNSGRNNSGKITSHRKGGGHKRNYREIDFYRKESCLGIVMSIEHDPNRTAYIAAVYDLLNTKHFYMIAPQNLKVGDLVKSGAIAEPKLGHSLPISKIPSGFLIHNVSPKTNKAGQISKAAGTFTKLMEKNNESARIVISSGEERMLSVDCFATVGVVSNNLHFFNTKGKAGRSRWLNKRPAVRGVAMNPVDHPNGGGEGKKSGLSKTPWGKSNNKGSTSKTKNKLIIKIYKNAKI